MNVKVKRVLQTLFQMEFHTLGEGDEAIHGFFLNPIAYAVVMFLLYVLMFVFFSDSQIRWP